MIGQEIDNARMWDVSLRGNGTYSFQTTHGVTPKSLKISLSRNIVQCSITGQREEAKFHLFREIQLRPSKGGCNSYISRYIKV